jgi:hypothetical protein
MKSLFREVLDIDGVKGAMLFSVYGDFLFKEFAGRFPAKGENKKFWADTLSSFKGVKECEVISEGSMLYIKETALGYLLILMESSTRIALVRLNCDLITAAIDEQKSPKGRWGLFKRKK